MVPCDLCVHVAQLEVQKHGRGIDPRAHTHFCDLPKTQHAHIKKRVTGMYFDKCVGGTVYDPRVNISDIEQRTQHLLGTVLRFYREVRYLTDSASQLAERVDFLLVEGVGLQASLRIESQSKRAEKL